MKTQLCHSFEDIICLENLLEAWKEFKKGKKQRKDVQTFQMRLMDNIFSLHRELFNFTYKHGGYQAFKINDPKPRDIHKATVCDRLLHHAIYRKLYPFFDKTFIVDSYSCRIEKGTHRAVKCLEKFCRRLSQNNFQNIFALKCDVKKFFDSVDQDILLKLIRKKVQDENALWLIEKIIRSFPEGLPLGNVTSQIFANIYLDDLDQFAKHNLREKYYIRYCDDFIILSVDEKYLQNLIPKVNSFLQKNLKLNLHPNKIIIRKCRQGVDFLGYVALPHYRVLRTKTKRRMLKKISGKHEDLQGGLTSEDSFEQSLQSYLGILKYCEGRKIEKILQELYIQGYTVNV